LPGARLELERLTHPAVIELMQQQIGEAAARDAPVVVVDVPLLFEGPPPPMRRLAEILLQLTETHSTTYLWSAPVMLSDEVVVLAYRDRSVAGKELSDGARIADYVMNLVRPVVFTFLHDCAVIAHLRLSEKIEMRVSAESRSVVEFALPLQDIVQPNGERLLWGVA